MTREENVGEPGEVIEPDELNGNDVLTHAHSSITSCVTGCGGLLSPMGDKTPCDTIVNLDSKNGSQADDKDMQAPELQVLKVNTELNAEPKTKSHKYPLWQSFSRNFVKLKNLDSFDDIRLANLVADDSQKLSIREKASSILHCRALDRDVRKQLQLLVHHTTAHASGNPPNCVKVDIDSVALSDEMDEQDRKE